MSLLHAARRLPAATGQRAQLHHELYLSGVRETVPLKMRTILRQPARAA